MTDRRTPKFHETFGIQNAGDDVILLEYYRQATSASSIDRFDYFLSRVNNTPTVSNGILAQDYNRFQVINRLTSSELINGVSVDSYNEDETANLAIIDENKYGNLSNKFSKADHYFKKLVDEVVELIVTKYRDYGTDILKVFAYFIVISGTYQNASNKYLRKFINELVIVNPLTVRYMYEYIGTEHRLRSARKALNNIFNDLGVNYEI